MLNKSLRTLYLDSLSGLSQMYSNLDEDGVTEYVGPLLIQCWEDKYLSSKHKLIVFGQETYGWYEDYLRSSEDVDDCLKLYSDFKLGGNYRSLFWDYAHLINRRINDVDNLNFIWSNVNKFGVDGAGKPDSRVLENENTCFNLMSKELDILNPDVCIFLSGPNYDQDIKAKLDDLEIIPYPRYPVNEAAILRSRHLPEHSFRTYHPGYGNRYKEWYLELLEKFISDCE